MGLSFGLGLPPAPKKGGRAIDPATLSPLRLYDASRITGFAEGAAVTSWPDVSAANDPAVPPSGVTGPLYRATGANGKPCVEFSGGFGPVLQFTRLTTVRTIVAVLRMDTPFVDYETILGDTSGADLGGDVGTGYNCGNMFYSSPFFAAISGGSYTYNGRSGGAASKAIRPTSFAVILLETATAVAASYISQERVQQRRLKGRYAYLTLFDRVLSSAEKDGVARFLTAKYAITLRSKPTTPVDASIVFDGDSLTFGQGSTGGNTYYRQLATAFGAGRLVGTVTAVSGSTAATIDQTRYATTVPQAFRDQAAKNVYAIWAGINDLANTSATPTQVYGYLKSLWARARADGYKIAAFTVTPSQAAGLRAGFEADRQSLNTMIRSDPSLYDVLVDVAADSRIGPEAAAADTTYYSPDKIHMNNTGYGVVAELANTALSLIV